MDSSPGRTRSADYNTPNADVVCYSQRLEVGKGEID